MAEIITVTVHNLPPIAAVTGDEEIAAYKDGKLGKIPQAALRGTRLFTGPTDPPSLPSVIAALLPTLNDRWRNTITGDEWKVASLKPFVWMPDGNVKGADGASEEPGPRGPPGEKGEKGEPGSSGTGDTIITGTAAVVTGGHKALYARPDGSGLAAASASSIAQAGLVVGISTAAAAANGPITYVNDGPIDEPTWAFTPGAVWLGQDGNIVQPAPSSGFVQVVGTAVTPTRIVVSIQTPFILAA